MKLHRPSPAMIVACAALFVALAGTAVAARTYVITNVHQIKPSVLNQLGAASGAGPYSFAPTQATQIAPGHYDVASTYCRPGFHLVSGGYSGEVPAGAQIVSNGPSPANGWTVIVDAMHAQGETTVTARALCAPGQLQTYPSRN